MLGLRSKLIIGFGSLLVLLLLTGGIGLSLLIHYSGTVDRVFRENYDSVVYGQSMKDAIDRLDDALELAAQGRGQPEDGQLQAACKDFQDNFRREAGNITLPGEREIVAELQARWERLQGMLATLAPSRMQPPQLRASLGTQVFPAARAVKEQAQRVIDINLENIVSADGQIRRSAASARRGMFALLAIGMVLAVGFILLFVRSILVPLRTLTSSAREIERGNLDLVVPVAADDEIGQLADAFNSMAGKLRETRRSDRLKIVRAQRTTQLTLDSLPDAVAVIGVEGRVDFANQAAQRLFRLRPGTPLAEIGTAQLTDAFHQVLATGQPLHPKGFEAVIQVFDDDERFFLPHALPIRDADGAVVGVNLVITDITGLRRLDEMKSNLLAVVSHELKTPLTGLRMATHLLLDERTGSLNQQQTELLLSARDESARLHTIVEGLLDISRLQSGRALMELKPVEPWTLVERAVQEAMAAYRDKGVNLTSDCPASLPAVMADAVRIDHVFANLLGNALKYTSSGGTVAVVAVAKESVVEFQVQDSGIGIDPEHRQRIFERFYRIPGQANAGAGLGLAIAKEIVLAHGGRIWLSDLPAAGSQFCFTIPCAVAPMPVALPEAAPTT